MLKWISNLLDTNQRELKNLEPLVSQTNEWESEISKLKDNELKGKTSEFKKRLSQGELLNDFLPEALAVAREAIKRTVGERAYDVQLMAALVLHDGKIAEQKTGEGKTLSAALAAYLHALNGQGVHIVTVNDYLARRDAGWYGKALDLLGLTVGVIYGGMGDQPAAILDLEHENKDEEDERLENLKPSSRKEAYEADITYGTNNEFGFDYLRDNMVHRMEDKVQREHNYAIVDEVDSILIDEARTPLIISAPDTDPTDKYFEYAKLVKTLSKDTDYELDEKLKSATLTDYGIRRLEQRLKVDNLYEESYETVHHVEQALKAEALFQKDRDYVVQDDEVIIVDEHTGRMMYGRRYSDGLHQAIEAKEGVKIQQESRTLATISIQNYFRMYEKLAGMTGTAATEGEEFKKIYDLDVVVMPTNKPVIRKDRSDLIYKTVRAKYSAIVRSVEEKHKKGQPVLIGTKSIDHNEIISRYLKKKNVPHEVLNAKNHKREAQIIADAGRPGSVTVATNIAGRGVDIVLGGDKSDRDKKEWQKDHDKVLELGGLHVIGAERHDSRRIDNQLRGRSGRQGDPGSSRFYVSLEDDLMRIFGGDRIAGIMTALNIPEDQPIEHGMVSKSIEQAQVKVEGFHFDMRKRVVEYDDVMNKQRQVIYKMRDGILNDSESNPERLREKILNFVMGEIEIIVASRMTEGFSDEETNAIVKEFITIIPFDSDSQKKLLSSIEGEKDADKTIKSLQDIAKETYQERQGKIGEEVLGEIEKYAYLSTIDQKWMDHLDNMDSLREGIGLRGYAQRDPLIEYQQEAFNMFERLIGSIESEVAKKIYRLNPVSDPQTMPSRNMILERKNMFEEEGEGVEGGNREPQKIVKPVKESKDIGRNDPCPCGSGLKWKKCGLINAPEHKG